MPECPVDLKPMSEWIQEDDPSGFCRECVLGPVVQWYGDELNTRGKTQLATELYGLANSDESTYLDICEKLDSIKKQADEPLRGRLLEFDCAAQTFNPDEMPA